MQKYVLYNWNGQLMYIAATKCIAKLFSDTTVGTRPMLLNANFI